MRKSRILATLALVVVISAPALADIQKGNVEFGMDAGYMQFDPEVSDSTGWGLNLRAGYFFTRHVELEGQFLIYVTSEGPVDIGVLGLFANTVYSFRPAKRIVPYVYLGLGWTRLDFSIDWETLGDDTTIGYQGGVGGRFFLDKTKRLGLRGEVSTLFEDTFDERKNYSTLAVGFVIRLGAD